MAGIHIIALFMLFILLIGVYFSARVHFQSNLLSKEKDFITVFFEWLEKHIKKNAENFKLDWYIMGFILSPIIVGIIVYLSTESGPMSVVVGIFGIFIPEGIIQLIRSQNRKKFEERYTRSLEQLSSSLRAGMSIYQAVEDVANCKFLHESMRAQYAKMSSDLQMGLTIAETFHRFAQESQSEDAKDVALAIEIQSQVGGHEADVVKEIANNINQRMMLRREVKTLFAETSSMVWIMDVLAPFVIMTYSISNPTYLQMYFSSPTHIAVFFFIISFMLLGSINNHYQIKKLMKGA